MQNQASPINPAAAAASPAKKEASPAKKEANPAKKEANPAKKEESPAKAKGREKVKEMQANLGSPRKPNLNGWLVPWIVWTHP